MRQRSFEPGKHGTILSIGCYTECWDASLQENTKENPVEVSTKRVIQARDVDALSMSVQWQGQLSFFVSCSTVSKWSRYERGTPSPFRRFQNFSVLQAHGIPAFLYVKSVIPGVTYGDARIFEVLNKEQVYVVVGNTFAPAPRGAEPRLAKEDSIAAILKMITVCGGR